MAKTVHEYWEKKYLDGHAQGYPWDMVVSFLMRAPRVLSKNKADIKILELGCGTGANLWCAAREGFEVTGIDISQVAVRNAEARFEADALNGTFLQAQFSPLPFDDESFDLVIDRASTACVDYAEMTNAIAEVHRVLKSEGLLFSQGYSADHTSMTKGTKFDEHTFQEIHGGTLAGQAQITFLSRQDIDELLKNKFMLAQLQHVMIEDVLSSEMGQHTEWRLVAQKL